MENSLANERTLSYGTIWNWMCRLAQYHRVLLLFAPTMAASACSVVTTELSASIASSNSKCLLLFTMTFFLLCMTVNFECTKFKRVSATKPVSTRTLMLHLINC